MSLTPRITHNFNEQYASTSSTAPTHNTTAKPHEWTRRITCGIGMVAPISVLIALAAWYIAI